MLTSIASPWTIEDPATIALAMHPVRAAILDALREPSTAASVARTIGQSRQNVAYHVRELEKAGLVRHVAERQNGNFLEQLYQRVAPTIVIAPGSTWGDPDARAAAMAEQLSLGELVRTGEALQRDCATLLDRAAFDGDEVPSASVITEIRFADERARAAFLEGYVDAVKKLARAHGSRQGTPFRLVLAAYPDPDPR